MTIKNKKLSLKLMKLTGTYALGCIPATLVELGLVKKGRYSFSLEDLKKHMEEKKCRN